MRRTYVQSAASCRSRACGLHAARRYAHSLSSRSAAGDGFALVYFKTEGWGDDADLVVTVGTNKYPMQHHPSSVGDYHSLHFWDTACIPVGKGTSWSVAFTNGSYSHSKFDVYWIPFGY